MANSYTQLYIHLIFVVNGRQSLIKENFREELQKYISGIIKVKGNKLLSIYCMPDHTHIFIGLNPDFSISDIVRDIKANSSRWINQNNFLNAKFEWQKGYGAFSYSHSQIDTVVKYILKQLEKHKVKTFMEEYTSFLEKFNIPYSKKYIFENVD